MCGISLLIQQQRQGCQQHEAGDGDLLRRMLWRRGPDKHGEHDVQAEAPDGTLLQLNFSMSLLQLRGLSSPKSVPWVDTNSGDTLCFNGEIFGGVHVPKGHNDGQTLLQALASCDDVPQLLSQLKGPWSLIYWQATSATLWFGRDVMGRRSLLLHTPAGDDHGNGALALCSVACMPGNHTASMPPPDTVPATSTSVADEGSRDDECEHNDDPAAFWKEAPPGIYSLSLSAASSDGEAPPDRIHAHDLDTRLPWGLQLWCHDWSGTAVVARVGAYVRPEAKHSSSSSGGGVETSASLQQPDAGLQPGIAAGCAPDAGIHCADTQASPGACSTSRSAGPMTGTGSDVDALLLKALQTAVDVRCSCHDDRPDMAVGAPEGNSLQPRVMILFSGGVDSTLLAALAHRSLPPAMPIDLSNVCFDSGRSPDRLSAVAALQELSAWAPSRQWRLVEVDATLEDTDTHKEHLLRLLHPAGTVMDLNIGAALWLAASGKGRLRLPESQHCSRADDPHGSSAADVPQAHAGITGGSPHGIAASSPDVPTGQPYISPARIVLVGHGADEQCAGYGRHRTCFRSGGLDGLSAELSLDVRRMWRRNCGRDDRLIADNGREARHPFLDEDVMDLLLHLPLQCIADLREKPGVGDKQILRRALLCLGLHEASARVKRAIQFGSRIGKLSNRREFGSNRAANRANAGSLDLAKLPAAGVAADQ